ncbi:carbon-nitrogen hydrolase family protein [Aquipseudomonas alcaligenes]|uniref:Carbon-nitrogen hydrolase family protein n=1 Tax=Aquipseudomonas alcaligenes TaxID=43263 RepID=A0A2V4LLS3_AQUAC|nr:carbon-nitrogen hydrolase family protein [Pseudomonas alcaligenes]PYC25750.1 carbon-nitrogen hydrolase family protein [Pseudomonas alcaligenes]
MPSLCLAAAQSLSIPGDLAANIERHCAFVHAAAEAGVELLLFPELSLSGYEPERVASCVVDPAGPALAPLRELAQQKKMILILGAPLASGSERPHIGAIVLFPDGSHATYHKRHLHPGEERWASAGDAASCSFALGAERCALAICADTGHAEHAAAAAATGASLYLAGVLISKQGYATDSATLQGHAARHGFGVLMANHGGPSGGYAAAGRSAFWDARGQLVGATEGPGEQLLILRGQPDGAWSAQRLTP